MEIIERWIKLREIENDADKETNGFLQSRKRRAKKRDENTFVNVNALYKFSPYLLLNQPLLLGERS